MASIVQVVNRIRREVLQEPGERAEAYFKRTWLMAIAEVERRKEELPLVKARRERSEEKLRHIFNPDGSLIEGNKVNENELE